MRRHNNIVATTTTCSFTEFEVVMAGEVRVDPSWSLGWGRVVQVCLAFMAATSLLVLQGGCDTSTSERCKELRSAADAKAAALPRSCQSDLDCFVYEVRPSYYVAVSTPPDDPELLATVDAYAAECEAPEPIPNVFGAGCFEFTAGTASAVETRKLCALTYGGEIFDFETADVSGLDINSCDCVSHEDCGPSELCQGNCQCARRCEAACGQADACGPETLPDLGIGSDYATCVDVCEVNLFDETLQAQVRCLSTAACAALDACLR